MGTPLAKSVLGAAQAGIFLARPFMKRTLEEVYEPNETEAAAGFSAAEADGALGAVADAMRGRRPPAAPSASASNVEEDLFDAADAQTLAIAAAGRESVPGWESDPRAVLTEEALCPLGVALERGISPSDALVRSVLRSALGRDAYVGSGDGRILFALRGFALAIEWPPTRGLRRWYPLAHPRAVAAGVPARGLEM